MDRNNRTFGIAVLCSAGYPNEDLATLLNVEKVDQVRVPGTLIHLANGGTMAEYLEGQVKFLVDNHHPCTIGIFWHAGCCEEKRLLHRNLDLAQGKEQLLKVKEMLTKLGVPIVGYAVPADIWRPNKVC
jgi:hypothetical protein